MTNEQLEQALHKLKTYQTYYRYYEKKYEELYGVEDYNNMEQYKNSIESVLSVLQESVSADEFSKIQKELAGA